MLPFVLVALEMLLRSVDIVGQYIVYGTELSFEEAAW
jgi:hypothetical protein